MLQALGGLARLVREGAYREAVLEGLAAAVGGLDGALASAAAAALGDALADADEGAPAPPRMHAPPRRTYVTRPRCVGSKAGMQIVPREFPRNSGPATILGTC